MKTDQEIELMLSELEALSEREGRLDFQLLINDRNKFGFRHKIMDLKGKNAKGEGWTLNDGLLVVDKIHDSDDLMNMLERDDMLGKKTWFQKRTDKKAAEQNGEIFEEPALSNGYKYTEQFKTLGYWGENPAMDVIKFITMADGRLGVRVIKRTDTLKWAFVGGMIDKKTGETNENVLKTCFKETLEELYSKKLFEENSRSANAAAKIDPKTFAAIFSEIFVTKNDEKSEFEELQQKGIVDVLKPLFQNDKADFPSRITAMKKAVFDKCRSAGISPFDTEVAWVRIKCRMYEALWPQQLGKLNKFLRENFVAMPKTIVEADNRNTKAAYMTTRPHYIHIDHKVMDDLEKELELDAAGGDDALTAKILPLEELFQEAMFASHGKILAQSLTHLISSNPTLLNNQDIVNQIKAVKSNIEKRELEMYGAVQQNLKAAPGQNSGLIMRTRNPQAVISPYLANSASSSKPAAQQEDAVLPSAASEGQVAQLNALQKMANDKVKEFEVIDEVTQAYDDLQTKVGPEALARIARDMEAYGLGQNTYMVMNELNGFHSVNILIDDSGSMTGSYEYEDNNGKQRHSRWNEAHRRLNVLIPLLANAGVRVCIRLLNASTTSPSKDFDFTRKQNETSANYALGLEAKITNALSHIQSIFLQSPPGQTYVITPLNTFFNATPQGQRSLTFFLTDGEPNEPTAKVISDCLNRRNKEANPVTFVACTNDAAAVAWLVDHSYKVDSQGKREGVQVLMDYPSQLGCLKVAQGDNLPYSRQMYLLHHLVAPSTQPQDLPGLHVLELANQGKKLTVKQVAQWTGLNMDPSYYALYEQAYNRAHPQSNAVSSTLMNSGGYSGASSSSASSSSSAGPSSSSGSSFGKLF